MNICLRVGDTEAPDLKPKVSRNKKKKSKKKRKKKKNPDETPNDPDISLEKIELDDNKDEEDPVAEHKVPIQLVECKRSNCGKKFASESALKYHVSFAHEKLFPQGNETSHIEDFNKTSSLNKKVEPQTQAVTNPECTVKKIPDITRNMKTPINGHDDDVQKHKTIMNKPENEKQKSKQFPSTQNIRPIVPVQAPKIVGSSLKPIQPKPTTLPTPTLNLSLNNLKRSPKHSPGHQVEKSSKANCDDLSLKAGLKYQNINTVDNEPEVIDLSTNKAGTINTDLEINAKKKSLTANLYANTKPIQRETELAINVQQQKETKKQESVKESVMKKIPDNLQSSKEKSPSIFVKTEFNTGHSKNLSDQTDQPEILKHTKLGENVPISTKSIKSSIFSNPMAYLPHSYFSSPNAAPGLMMPPTNTNPLMLPGLMNIPPPAAAAPSSPFGSSLESLARAAEERARNFGSYSPAHIPAAFSPAHVPAAFSPAHVPAAFSPANIPASNSQRPSTSDSSETPLLRHEHMHTHLHYITSPTHST